MGISPSRDWCNILAAGTYHRFWWFGDTDEITGIPAICEYTLRPVGICNFCHFSIVTRFAVSIAVFWGR